jgi:hypothetical protein
MSDFKTTINPHGIGTSLTKDKNYFISTVESPPTSGRYETIVKLSGVNVIPILVIVSYSIKESVKQHISLSRMVISMNVSDWNVDNVNLFTPKDLIDSLPINLDSSSINSEYVDTLLRMSGLNYGSSNGNSSTPMVGNVMFVLGAIILLYLLFNYFA